MSTKTTTFPDPVSLGLAIRSARKRAKLSQQAVADHLQVKRTTFIAIEKGERRLRAEEFPLLSEILQIDFSSLLAESQVQHIKGRLLTLPRCAAVVIEQLANMPFDPVLGKILTNLYDTPALQEAVAATLIHLLTQQQSQEPDPIQERMALGA
jgi:transcriptional regulator with XRE-family HTH domain